jgi:hypothetical protein
LKFEKDFGRSRNSKPSRDLLTFTSSEPSAFPSTSSSGVHCSDAMIAATKTPQQSTSISEIDQLQQLQEPITDKARSENVRSKNIEPIHGN